jgi:RNA polymerase sigma factor (sigma-70 family)
MNRHHLSDPLLRLQPDERLAALAAHGGERAFAVLVERHRPRLVAFARRSGASLGAEDVVQQALLQAWSALGRGAQVEHVSAWLHRIVRNAAIRAAAARGDGVELPATLVAATETADEVEMRQRTRDLLKEIERLPPRQREALLRLAFDGSSGEEIGREMALDPNAVRQLAHRARTRLRMAMGALVPWPLALWAARSSAAGVRLVDGVPELAGGAGAAAGLVKLGTIASTTAAVAVGAAGIVPHAVRHRRAHARPAVTHASAAGLVPTAAQPATTRTVSAAPGRSHARSRRLRRVWKPHRSLLASPRSGDDGAAHDRGENGSRRTQSRAPGSGGEEPSPLRDGGASGSGEHDDGGSTATTTTRGDDGGSTQQDGTQAGGNDGAPGAPAAGGSDDSSGTTSTTPSGDDH